MAWVLGKEECVSYDNRGLPLLRQADAGMMAVRSESSGSAPPPLLLTHLKKWMSIASDPFPYFHPAAAAAAFVRSTRVSIQGTSTSRRSYAGGS